MEHGDESTEPGCTLIVTLFHVSPIIRPLGSADAQFDEITWLLLRSWHKQDLFWSGV